MIDMEQFQTLLARRAAAQRELEGVAQLDGLDDAKIRTAILTRPGGYVAGIAAWSPRLIATRRFLAARAAVDGAAAEIERRRSDIAAELEQLTAQPAPLPGSRAAEQLAARVRWLETEGPRLQGCLATAEAVNYDPLIERALRAQRRLAAVLVQLAAEHAVASIAGAIDQHWHHAREVLAPLEAYATLVRTVRDAVGEPVAAPVIAFVGADAWRRLLDREGPRLESPAPAA